MDIAGLPARLQARLARGRAMAEARMGAANGASDVNVYRLRGREEQDEETGREGPIWDPVHEGLPFRIGGGQGPARTVQTPGGEVQVALRTGSFPATTTNLRDGDLIEVAAGENAGTFWSIVEADWADQQTAHRVPIVATTKPEGWF